MIVWGCICAPVQDRIEKRAFDFFSQVEARFMRCVLYYYLAIIRKGRVWSEEFWRSSRRVLSTEENG